MCVLVDRTNTDYKNQIRIERLKQGLNEYVKKYKIGL